MSRRTTRCALALAVALSLAASACGDDDGASPATDATDPSSAAAATCDGAGPYTATDSAGTVALDAQPERIISLWPTYTEMLFAIGAGDQVVAVDDQSNYPAQALDKPNDLSGIEPNIEAITAYEPDLVVIGEASTGLAEQLDAVDIPVWSGATAVTFDDVYDQIEQLGSLTGCDDGATDTATDVRKRVDAAVASIEPSSEPLTYYHELDPTYYTATSDTFIGQVYGLFGMENIADGVSAGNSYPQLSPEAIIEANPDVVFLADSRCCAQTPEAVAARPGWSNIDAVANGRVIVIDDDLASRWGPRVADFVEAVAAGLAGASGSGS